MAFSDDYRCAMYKLDTSIYSKQAEVDNFFIIKNHTFISGMIRQNSNKQRFPAYPFGELGELYGLMHFIFFVAQTRWLFRFIVVMFALLPLGCGERTNSEPKEHPGKTIYLRYCQSCHQGGVAGSPTFGDKEAWPPRLTKGRDELLKRTREGIPPGMPAKGLCMSCSERELRDAVDYMIQAVEPDDESSK